MVYLIMGVSGSGKTTIGFELSKIFNAEFLDADDFHSLTNISKMRKGIPLSDQDRKNWLIVLNARLKNITAFNNKVIIACSALKNRYRKIILEGIEDYLIIFLHGDVTILKDRLQNRKGHFFNSILLESQLNILAPPTKDFISISVNMSKSAVIEKILMEINLLKIC